jgi:integrase
VIASVDYRQGEGAKNATINRELACLRRMFRIGKTAGKVAFCPEIKMLQEDNVRTGFFEPADFRSVVQDLPDEVKPIAEVAYITGWRIASEILTRQWRHVDFEGGFLRLEPGETKNRKGRMFPLTPELRQVLQRQRDLTEALERNGGRSIPWVFHREGERIRVFRRSWVRACVKAGLATLVRKKESGAVRVVLHRIPHDLRRTAVRNLERAGVPRSAAMAMVGHLTESIYRRYAIADESMLRDAALRLAELHRQQGAIAR